VEHWRPGELGLCPEASSCFILANLVTMQVDGCLLVLGGGTSSNMQMKKKAFL
jgi:hypothetical protein